MGTDDSLHTNKRGIAKISRALLSSNTQVPMRTNLATKFLLLVAIITLLIYVLADHVSPPYQPTNPIRAAETLPVSAPFPAAPGVPPSSASLETHIAEKVDEQPQSKEVEVVSEKRRTDVQRNIGKLCNHTVIGYGTRTVMHDILNYISILKKPITYLDVGANVGITSLPVLFCFKQEHRVIAIEPVRVNYEAIVRSQNDLSITPLSEERFLAANVGFADETKKTKMFIPGKRGDNAALAEKASTTVFKNQLRSEEVLVYRGAEFLKSHGAEPGLIKIDVQGSEIRVLKGLEEYLKSGNTMLIMAEHDHRLIENSGFGLYDVFDYMKELEFKIYYHPKVSVRRDEFWVESDEIERENLQKIRGDLVFWNGGE